MAKNGVEGVLDGDPREDPDAKLIPELTHLQAIERGSESDGHDGAVALHGQSTFRSTCSSSHPATSGG